MKLECTVAKSPSLSRTFLFLMTQTTTAKSHRKEQNYTAALAAAVWVASCHPIPALGLRGFGGVSCSEGGPGFPFHLHPSLFCNCELSFKSLFQPRFFCVCDTASLRLIYQMKGHWKPTESDQSLMKNQQTLKSHH